MSGRSCLSVRPGAGALLLSLLAALTWAAPLRAQEPGAESEEGPADESRGAAALATEGIGVAVVGEDSVRARERAMADAIQRALERAVLQVAPEARGRLYVVSGRARQYITSLRVLSEGESGGQLQVRISAQVDVPRLLRDLRPSTGSPASPRVTPRRAVLLCAALPTASTPGAEALLTAALLALREDLSSGLVLAPESACPTAGADALPRALAQEKAAAAVVLESLTSAQAPTLIRGTQPPLFGAAQHLTLTLYTDKGERLSVTLAEGQDPFGFGDSIEAAQRAAARLAAQRAAEALRTQHRGALPLRSPADDGAALQLTLEGVPSYAAYQALLRTLAALPGVQSVEPQRFSPPESLVGLAVVTAQAGGPAELGALLSRTPLPGLRVQVMPPEGNKLRVLVAPERALPAAPREDAVLPAAPPPTAGSTP